MDINFKAKFEAEGSYNLVVLDKEGNRVEEKCVNNNKNVVTYWGANEFLLVQSNPFKNLYAGVGTGVSEITRDATNLGSPAFSRSAAVNGPTRLEAESDNGDGTSTLDLTRAFSFGLGVITGTISEVGVFASATGENLVAGQLIKDEFGNPTTITLLSDEQLIVTYTLKFIVPNAPFLAGSGTVQDALSNSYDYEVWGQQYFSRSAPSSVSNTRYNNASYTNTNQSAVFHSASGSVLHARNGASAGSLNRTDGTVSITSQRYTAPPSAYSGDTAFISLGSGDQGPLDSVSPPTARDNNSNSCPWVVSFSPALPKTANDTLQIRLQGTLEL